MTTDEMQEETPSKWISVPHAILASQDISMFEKILWCEIQSLERDGIPCYAGNAHFEKIFGYDKSTISRALSNLKDLGYLSISYSSPETKTGRRLQTYFPEQSISNNIEIDQTTIDKKINTIDQKVKPLDQKVKEEDIQIENNKIKETKEKLKMIKPKVEREVTYLLVIPPKDIDGFSERYQLTNEEIVLEGQKAYDWVVAKGQIYKYKDYRHFFSNWLRNCSTWKAEKNNGSAKYVEQPQKTYVNEAEMAYFKDSQVHDDTYRTFGYYMIVKKNMEKGLYTEEELSNPNTDVGNLIAWSNSCKNNSLRVWNDLEKRYINEMLLKGGTT